MLFSISLALSDAHSHIACVLYRQKNKEMGAAASLRPNANDACWEANGWHPPTQDELRMGFGCFPAAITMASMWVRLGGSPELCHLAGAGYPMFDVVAQTDVDEITRRVFQIVYNYARLGDESLFPKDRAAARCMLLALHRTGVAMSLATFFRAGDSHPILAHAMLDLNPTMIQLDFNSDAFNFQYLVCGKRTTLPMIRRVLDRMTDRTLEKLRHCYLIESAAHVTIDRGDDTIVPLLLTRAHRDGTGIQLGFQEPLLNFGDRLEQEHNAAPRWGQQEPNRDWSTSVRPKLIEAFLVRDLYCDRLFGTLTDALAGTGMNNIPKLVSFVEQYILLRPPERDFRGHVLVLGARLASDTDTRSAKRQRVC